LKAFFMVFPIKLKKGIKSRDHRCKLKL
jgi:hypothetical protein